MSADAVDAGSERAARWQTVAVAGHTGDLATARAALTADDASLRELALGALERMGALSDEDVAKAITDPAAGVRRRALRLAALRPSCDLLAALADHDPSVVEVAAWAAGERESVNEGVFAKLCALATGAPDALVREAAVAALGALGDQRGLAAILHGCGDSPAVRRRAVLALAPFSGPQVDAALDAARADRDWQVRQAAEDVAAD